MAKLWKIAPAFLIALLVSIAVACGGGGDDSGNGADGAGSGGGDSASQDGKLGDPSEPLVANISEALGRSVESFQQDVNSVRAEFTMDVEAGEMSMSGGGEMAFKSPDEFYMKFEIDAEGGGDFVDLSQFGTFEVIARGEEVWMYMPFFGGWFYMNAEEAASSDFTFGDFGADGAPFDYEKLVEAFGDAVEDFGEEEIDGGVFRHFRVTITADEMLSAFGEMFGDGESTGFEELPAEALTQPLVVDFWLHPDSFLPHRMDASAAFDVEGEAAEIAFSLRFLDYNEDFSLPDPPEDAQSFEELFGGLFGDMEFEFEFETEAP